MVVHLNYVDALNPFHHDKFIGMTMQKKVFFFCLTDILSLTIIKKRLKWGV